MLYLPGRFSAAYLHRSLTSPPLRLSYGAKNIYGEKKEEIRLSLSLSRETGAGGRQDPPVPPSRANVTDCIVCAYVVHCSLFPPCAKAARPSYTLSGKGGLEQ